MDKLYSPVVWFLLLCLVAGCHGDIVFSQNFDGNGAMDVVGWRSVMNAGSSAGISSGLAWVWHAAQSENVIYATDVNLPNNSAVRYAFDFALSKHSYYSCSPLTSIVVRVNNGWYVSKNRYGTASTVFCQRRFIYEPSKIYWDTLNISTGARGSSASSNLSGNITGIGFYSNSVNMAGAGTAVYDYIAISTLPSQLNGDIDVNGAINYIDLQEFALSYLQQTFNPYCDINQDGSVDLKDLASLAEDWFLGISSYSAMNGNRLENSFNFGWKFYKGNITGAENPTFNDSSWPAVTVPHNPPKVTGQIDPARPCWNDSGSYQYEGVSWYRKHFTVDSNYVGRKVVIEFGAVNTVANVYLNGQSILTHMGGYLPFTIDATSILNYGGTDNVIAVKADNTDNNEIPIGNSGWFNWGGIYRGVKLVVTDKLHITNAVYANKIAGGGLFITYPDVDANRAIMSLQTHVVNEYSQARNAALMTYVVDVNNIIVARGASEVASIAAAGEYTFIQNFVITAPRLWHPDHPNLYTVYVQLYSDSNIVDTVSTRTGIRRIVFNRDGFFINGQRLRLRGANTLEMFPYVGYAMSPEQNKRDVFRLKEAGFNFTRHSSYPVTPEFLDECDELGICVLEAIPGFQHIGSTAEFQNLCYQNTRDLVRRDRNHASLILWELSLGETWWTDKNFTVNLMNVGHEEYPGDQFYVTGWKDLGIWPNSTDFPAVYDIAIRNSDHNPSAWDYSGPLPLVIDEYGSWRYMNSYPYDSLAVRGAELDMLYQVRNHQESLNHQMGMSAWMCGDALWTFIDYACYNEGTIDPFRIPKFSYYFYQSQRDPDHIIQGLDSGPMVYIANYWLSSSPMGTITVYSNCEQVTLYRNGSILGTASPSTDVNSVYLDHAPFKFNNVTWQSGTLRAEGYIGGVLAAAHEVKTPGSKSKINIEFNLNGVPFAADGDVIFVYAKVLDSTGLFVPNVNTGTVTLNVVSGPATIISPQTVSIEYGIATFLLRSTGQPGQVTITASSSGLQSDTKSVTSY